MTYSGLLGDIREDSAQVGEVGGDSLVENIYYLGALRQTLRNISRHIPLSTVISELIPLASTYLLFDGGEFLQESLFTAETLHERESDAVGVG